MGIGVINTEKKLITLTYDKPVDVSSGKNYVKIMLDNYEFVLCEASARLLAQKLNAEFAWLERDEWAQFRTSHFRQREEEKKKKGKK